MDENLFKTFRSAGKFTAKCTVSSTKDAWFITGVAKDLDTGKRYFFKAERFDKLGVRGQPEDYTKSGKRRGVTPEIVEWLWKEKATSGKAIIDTSDVDEGIKQWFQSRAL